MTSSGSHALNFSTNSLSSTTGWLLPVLTRSTSPRQQTCLVLTTMHNSNNQRNQLKFLISKRTTTLQQSRRWSRETSSGIRLVQTGMTLLTTRFQPTAHSTTFPLSERSPQESISACYSPSRTTRQPTSCRISA